MVFFLIRRLTNPTLGRRDLTQEFKRMSLAKTKLSRISGFFPKAMTTHLISFHSSLTLSGSISPTPASLSASTFFKDNFICELRSSSHFYADRIYCSVLWAPNLYIQMVNFECPQPYLKGKHANAVVWSETKLILISPFPPPPRLDSTPGQPGSGDDPAVQVVLQTKGLGVVPNTPLSPGSHRSVHYSSCIFSNLLISFQLLCCLLSSSCHHFSTNWSPNTSSCRSPLLIKSNYFFKW